jgi:hypothetical protein
MNDTQIRAIEAQAILDNPLFKAAFADAREAIIRAIEDGDITASDRRDKYMVALQLLKSIQGNIRNHILTGQMAAIEPETY